MIEARLALTGLSAPGPDACRAWRQRERGVDAVIARPSGRWTSGADRKGRGCRLLRVGRGAGAVRSPSRAGRLVQPSLNGATSGLVLEYRPAGLGYQIHTCIVVRSGCQKLNLDPVPGLVLGQVVEFWSGMNVPSL